jgi:histone H2A
MLSCFACLPSTNSACTLPPFLSSLLLHPTDPLPKMATPKKSPATVKKSRVVSKKRGNYGLKFPVGRIGSLLRKGAYAPRVSASSGIYMAAVLEYLTAELLELSTKALVADKKSAKRITPRAVLLAVRNDADLGALLKDVTVSRGGVVPTTKASSKSKAGKKSATA